MTIYTVKEGDTIDSIAQQFGLTRQRIIIENELPNPDKLVIGQNIGIRIPDVTHTVVAGDTLYSVAGQYDVDANRILQNNPQIAAQETLTPGDVLVITYSGEQVIDTVLINGYAYPFIDRSVYRKTLPFLTNVLLFNYGFSPEGVLVPIDDSELIAIANEFGVAPIMVLAPMNEQGVFDTQIAHNMFANPAGQKALINNIVNTLNTKGYKGVDVDFEFILPEDKAAFLNFITALHTSLSAFGYVVFVALAPKTSGTQVGLLYEAHDYPTIGGVADEVLLMTYEWGYTYGPAEATSPINKMRQVLEYGVSVIDPNKILMGIPNYAYDWPLPFVKGTTAAESISNQDAVVRAVRYGVNIQFDATAASPFYNYDDEQGVSHVVWFDDVKSMDAKLRLIPEFKLHGGGVWQITNYFPGLWMVVGSLFTVEKV